MSLLPIILMFVVLWFIIIHLQVRCQRKTEAVLETLAKGDGVVTAGGILDKVSRVAEQYVTVEIAANTEIAVQKNTVTTVLSRSTLKAL